MTIRKLVRTNKTTQGQVASRYYFYKRQTNFHKYWKQHENKLKIKENKTVMVHEMKQLYRLEITKCILRGRKSQNYD